MNILDKIIRDKKREVALKKSIIPVSQLEKSVLMSRSVVSLSKVLKQSKSGIIAEHKRRSPSKPMINNSQDVDLVAKGYENAGVCGMSVLTDGKYFGGSLDDLILSRSAVKIPLLRKEFIIDEYQILEAKACGADVILLIAAALTQEESKKLSKYAKNIGLEVLLEIHNEEELLRSLIPNVDMIGVNNRNLKTFETSIEISKTLSDKIPSDFVKISESGISNVEAIRDLQGYGYKGFLIGENFMKTDNPGASAKTFINILKI